MSWSLRLSDGSNRYVPDKLHIPCSETRFAIMITLTTGEIATINSKGDWHGGKGAKTEITSQGAHIGQSSGHLLHKQSIHHSHLLSPG
jgi:hypothetical protein